LLGLVVVLVVESPKSHDEDAIVPSRSVELFVKVQVKVVQFELKLATGATLAPPVDVPLDDVPLDEVPLDEVPLDEVPLDEVPLDEVPVVEVVEPPAVIVVDLESDLVAPELSVTVRVII
jgi:hypothetical protein